MKVLLAPLNWGLGHATRSAALVSRFLAEGHEVVLAGDGASLMWLEKRFQQLRVYRLPSLELSYSQSNTQTWAIAKQIPKLIHHARQDHRALQHILATEHFDMVISDNRFGLYKEKKLLTSPNTQFVYLTHQIFIPLPKGWRWAEPLATLIHKRIIAHYDECWIPDYADLPISLSGKLSHGKQLPQTAKYINPLSRFQVSKHSTFNIQLSTFNAIALLSGLEPQRTLFEQAIIARYLGKKEKVLIVRGKTRDAQCTLQKQNITLVSTLGDEELIPLLLHADKIITRSGYSTIMDLHILSQLFDNNLLSKTELHPTPGQPEQEYLAQLICSQQK